MTDHTAAPTALTDLDVLEARLGLRVAAALSARAEDLPADVSARLRFAREQALTRRKPEPAPAVEPVLVPAGPAPGLTPERPSVWWRWAGSLVPVAALLAGLFLIQERHFERQVEVAADIDAALLADDLPPSAYTDPGFREFLKAPLE